MKELRDEVNLMTIRGLKPGDVAPFKLARCVIGKYEGLVANCGAHGKQLFVSCHFAGHQLENIKAKAEAKGFSVVTGKGLLRYDDVSDGLLEKRRLCTHFLGVWSREGAQDVGHQSWPSPWLLWEFGAAEAFGLTWRLLISNEIEEAAWNRIAAHRQHQIYEESNFESMLGEILDVLADLPARNLGAIDTSESWRVSKLEWDCPLE